MRYQIETIPPFDKAIKQHAKKYRRIKADLVILAKILLADPFPVLLSQDLIGKHGK